MPRLPITNFGKLSARHMPGILTVRTMSGRSMFDEPVDVNHKDNHRTSLCDSPHTVSHTDSYTDSHTDRNDRLRHLIIGRITENEQKLTNNIGMNPDHCISAITCGMAFTGTSIGFYSVCSELIGQNPSTSDSRFTFPILFGTATVYLGSQIYQDIRYIVYKKSIRDTVLNDLNDKLKTDIDLLSILSKK
jgi:hypothetical protein